jgi:hypothetical protein
MPAWESTPRLAFLSPEPGSGKTRGLEVTELLVPNPVEAINVTPAYLFRKVGGEEDPEATVLFDEVDTLFGPKAREHEEVRAFLNAGHRRGAVAGRCVTRGETIETVEYPAFCAVALAGLGDLPDTVLTRSVVVKMRRRAKGERVAPFRRRVQQPIGHALRDRIAAWAATVVDGLADAWPEMPEGVTDRDADVWEAPLAVADAAGGDWPARARVAAVALVAESKESTPSLGVRLLADLRTVFRDQDVMSTSAILKALCALEEAPWGEIAKGEPLNARGLSARLKPYGVAPKTVRIGAETPKGYSREDLADAWSRYLPPPSSPQESATSATSATSTVGGASRDDQTPYQTGFDGGVADVADVADFGEDEGGDIFSDEGRPVAPSGRVCVECGVDLPAGWTARYCERHGGDVDEAEDVAAQPSEDDPRGDPRFAEAVAECVTMTDDEFAEAVRSEAWIEEHEPDTEDHPFMQAVLAEAARLRAEGEA